MTATQPKVYLLDIEGTVAPVSLVTEQLFPYARTHFESFLRSSLAAPAADLSQGSLLQDLMLLKLERMNETDPEAPGRKLVREISMSPEAAIPVLLQYIFWLMDRDRKSTALKSLQGKIWKAGFESGELKGTLFSDVPEAMTRWAKYAKVAIYSSGSVEAQQLLFRHTSYGDLSSLIASYFDTRTGAKSDKTSYESIASKLEVDPAEVIFFSDVVRELDAAREAGCRTRLVLREGNASVADAHGHEAITSLL